MSDLGGRFIRVRVRRMLPPLLILLLAAVPRIWLLHRVSEADFYHNDGREYLEISRQLAAGHGFSLSYYRWHELAPPSARPGGLHTDLARTPLFPLLGAGLFFLPFDVTASAKVLALILGLGAVYCVFLLGREAAGRRCGLWSALIFAFYPYALYYTVSWSTETLFLICAALAFCYLLRVCRGRWESLWLCGLFLGLAALTRPTALLLAPLFLCVVWLRFMALGAAKWVRRRRRRTLPKGAWKQLAGFLLAFTLLLAPWTVRNRIAGGRWTPATYYDGYVFWLSFSEIIYETYRTLDRPEYRETTDRVWKEEHAKYLARLRAKGLYDFAAASRQWKRWGWEWILQHPDKARYILKERLLHYFRMCPNLIVLRAWQIVLLRLFFSGLFLLALLGARRLRKRLTLLVLLLPVLFGLALAVPFLFVLRYRFPFFAPYLCVLGGAALAGMEKGIKNVLRRGSRCA